MRSGYSPKMEVAENTAERSVTEEARPELFKWHGAELIFIPAMMAAGLLGNALVLYITHCRWRLSIFSFFIKVLAWLDMSNLMIAMPPLILTTVHDDSPYFLSACRCTTFVALFTAVTSSLVLVVIAANRFRKLCQPQRSQVTLPLAKKLFFGCALLGIALSFPSMWIFGRDTVTYKGDITPVNISYCFILQEADVGLLIGWAVLTGITFLAITVSLIVLYGFTIVALHKHSLRMDSMLRRPSQASTSSKRISIKHTLVFIVVTVIFFVSYSPYFVTVIISIAFQSIEESMNALGKAFFDIAKLFPLLSNVANPIIYSFTSDRFRDECRKVFVLRPCRKVLGLVRKDSATNTSSRDMSQSEDT